MYVHDIEEQIVRAFQVAPPKPYLIHPPTADIRTIGTTTPRWLMPSTWLINIQASTKDDQMMRTIVFLEKFSIEQSMTELWNQVRVATGHGKISVPLHPHPEARAHQLIAEHECRASRDNLSENGQRITQS